MDISEKNARSRIDALFASCITLLRRNALSWVTQANQKVATDHVLSAIWPKSLRERLESDLGLAYVDLKAEFNSFMKYALTGSEAFQVVDVGPKWKRNKKNRHCRTNNKNLSGGNGDNSKLSGN